MLLVSWGNLAEFSSLEEEMTLDSLMNQDIGYWISLSDSSQEGTWRWQENHQIPSYRVSHKKLHLVWRAVAPLNFELGIKVGGVLESSGSQL